MMNSILKDEYLQDECSRLLPVIKGFQSNNPIGSIVFCAHNEENYLLSTIDSFTKIKTDLPIEIIAVNNASSDRTRNILEQTGIKVVDEKTKGLSYARNTGLEAAKGEIIFQTDADTKIPENWINAHFVNYSDENIGGIAGKINFEGVHFLYYLYRSGAIGFHVFLDLIGKGPKCVGGANLSYRKDAVMKIGGFHKGSDLGEDVLLFEKLSKIKETKVIKSKEISVKTNGRRFNNLHKTRSHLFSKINSIFSRVNEKDGICLNRTFEDIR